MRLKQFIPIQTIYENAKFTTSLLLKIPFANLIHIWSPIIVWFVFLKLLAGPNIFPFYLLVISSFICTCLLFMYQLKFKIFSILFVHFRVFKILIFYHIFCKFTFLLCSFEMQKLNIFYKIRFPFNISNLKILPQPEQSFL